MFRLSTAMSERLVRCLLQVLIAGVIAQTFGCASSSTATDATPVALEGVRGAGKCAGAVIADGANYGCGGAESYGVAELLRIGAVGGQELFGEKDATAVRSLRREDLPGKPLAWRVALRELVSQLTGDSLLDRFHWVSGP